MSGLLSKYTHEFGGGRDLLSEGAEALLDAMIVESDEAQLAKLFSNWNKKGIAEDEIYAIAKIMRERCTKISSKHETFVDIVGTGGSRSKTFNVSTAAAFVVAGIGVPVAKHGNKAATSNSGSADVLAELGVKPDVDAATAERCLNELGICFMFAPNFHRLSPTLGKVRRGLGFPTIFNCVGPLCNPAGAPHQVIGVWDEALLPKMAGALARLGTRKSWIVHGDGGLDEVSFCGTTKVVEVDGSMVSSFELSTGEFGVLAAAESLKPVPSPAESAMMIRSILSNEMKDSAGERIVLLNAASALWVAGAADELSDAYSLALESVRSGNAVRKLTVLMKAVPV